MSHTISAAVIAAFEQRAAMAESLVARLRTQVNLLRAASEEKEIRRMEAENLALSAEVEKAKKELTAAERANGKVVYDLPKKGASGPAAAAAPAPAPAAAAAATPAATAPAAAKKEKAAPAANKEKPAADAAAAAPAKGDAAKGGDAKAKGKGGKEPAAAPAERAMDISRIDLRVGRIVSAKRLDDPEATKLYLEEIDLGEGKNRTVLSGLADYIPLDQMQNRMVVCCTNLKPRKMKGIESEAMVMCASTPEKVEILAPPEGSVPGDRVFVEGFPGEPDAELNPKKKVFETVAPDFLADANGVATYKGATWQIKGKGVCTAPTLRNVPIK